MKYETISRMKDKFNSFRKGKTTFVLDLSLFDSLNEDKDPDFARILTRGHGEDVTILRLKTEFLNQAMRSVPGNSDTVHVELTDPAGRTYCVDTENEMVIVHDRDTGEQAYAVIRPVAYSLCVYQDCPAGKVPVLFRMCESRIGKYTGNRKEAAG